MATVGIITYHWSDNYGAILQAFALQEALKGLGFHAEVIDYHNWYREYSGLRPLRVARRATRRYMERLFRNRERSKRTNRFRERYLQVSKSVYRDQDSLYANPPIYDAYICGSDQIWNPANNGFDQAYFLTFAPFGARKISYAASFGVSDLPTRYWGDYRVWLQQFDAISIREIEGIRIVSEVAGVAAERVLDPSMLLSKDDWRMISEEPKEQHPYILCYSVTNNDRNKQWIANTAKQAARLTDSTIVAVGNRLTFSGNQRVKQMLNACPAQFVGLIDRASVVITDSFHGTAFSIMFHKPFFLAVDPQFARNSRLKTLTSVFGLERRVWDSSMSLAFTRDMLEIEYEVIKARLADEQSRSLDFLRRSLAGLNPHNQSQ